MQIDVQVKIRGDDGTDLGMIAESEGDIPATEIPDMLIAMAGWMATGKEMADLLRPSVTTEHEEPSPSDRLAHPHDWDREPPAPSIPRRHHPQPTNEDSRREARPHWNPGNMVRLNDTSAEIFNTPPIRRRVLMHIARERYRHTNEKGWTPAHDATHRPNDWIAIVVQELAEATYTDLNPIIFRETMIKVAAVATAAVEALDRKDPEVREVLAEIEQRGEKGGDDGDDTAG